MESGSTWSLGLDRMCVPDLFGRVVAFAVAGIYLGVGVSAIAKDRSMPVWFFLLILVHSGIIYTLDFLRRRRAIARTHQALSGPMTDYRVPARVERNTLTAYGWRSPGCAVLLALPPDAPPRRVVVATSLQTGWPLSRLRSVHLVRLTADPEIAVLDTGVTAEDLAAAGADPRWQARMPSAVWSAGSTRQTLAGLAVAVASALVTVAILA